MSPRVSAAVQRTFASLRSSRNFRLYLLGQLVSALGTWMNFTASSWLILQLTGSGTALGLNGALMFGPILVLGAWGGVLADKHDKRRILAVTQTLAALVSLTLAGLVFTDVVRLWMVYALSLSAGLITAIDNPARQSFVVEMVGEDALTNAVSLHSAAFTGSRIFGTALAGLLIHYAGMGVCFLIDGVSYLAVLAALFSMRPDELFSPKRSTRTRGHLMAGLRYAWRTDDLRRPLIVMTVIYTTAFQWGVLIPLMAERVFHAGPREFGLLSAATGVGLFVAAITRAQRATPPSMRLLGAAAAGTGAAMAVAALAPNLRAGELAMVPVGFAAMTFMITANTMLQLTAKPEARGRVMALYGMVFLGSTPIGAPLVGVIAEHAGVRAAFLLSALIPLIVGAAVLWRERVRTAAALLGSGRVETAS